MDFRIAFEYMQEGKKIRRPTFHKDNYLYLDKHIIMSGISKERAYFCDKHFTCNDWEIVDERKTLSDRKHDKSMCAKTWDYAEEDVKEKINDFIEYLGKLNRMTIDMQKINSKAKELFGERLIVGK